MILMSCPAVSWPIRYDAAISSTANSDQVVEHLVAHRLLEHVDGDARDRPHDAPPSQPAVGAGARPPARTKTSSSVSRSGLSETSVRARPRRARASTLLGRRRRAAARARSGRRRARVRPRRAGASARRARRGVTPRHDQLPAAQLEREQVRQAARRDQPPAGEDRHAAAQRLGVAQHVRAEEHRAAAVAQPQDQLADLAPAERVEPRHRLVEEHDLGIVDERLRDADALQHALRELAQLQPALGADADLVEQRATRGAAAPPARSRTARRSTRAAPRRSGSRRSRDSRAGSRCGASPRRRRPAGRGSRRAPTSGRSAASAASAWSSCRRRSGRGSRRPRPAATLQRQRVEREVGPRTPESDRVVLGERLGPNRVHGPQFVGWLRPLQLVRNRRVEVRAGAGRRRS